LRDLARGNLLGPSAVSNVRPTLRFLTLGLSIAVLAAVAAWWRGAQLQRTLRQELIDRAQHYAVAFVTDDMAVLNGTRTDLQQREYRAVKDRLLRLHAVSPGLRFVYLFRSTNEPGRVVFLADSEPENSPELSRPGDDYPEAIDSPGLQSVLRTHQPTTDGPRRDSFGEWVSAYAPVGDRPPPGAPSTILGVDIDSSDWRRELWWARVSTFGVVVLLFGVPCGAWLYWRREAEHARVLQRFSAAIQQSHSAIVIANVDRVIEYVNNGCTAITGYTREELIGQPSRLLLPPHVDETERTELYRRLLAGERWTGEKQMRRRNGELFTVRVVYSPVRGPDGVINSLVAVADDITDLKRAENDLRVARDQAEAADRAKGEFLAVMSHELRTPLNGIIGFTTLLQDTTLSAEQKDYVDTVRRSGEALLTLTNELLDYSRIDAGRMRLDPQTCAPRLLVEEAVELLAARAAEKQLELIVTISPRVPTHVLADSGRLRQVLVNLVANAIKFTLAGEVAVEVEATTLPASGDTARVRLEFKVRDTGVGIAPESHDRLFLPFSQVDASSTRKYGGTGLGLAISRSLVRLMDGDIEVSSAAGAGAEFRVHLPVNVLEPYVGPGPLPPRRIALVSGHPRARAHYAALLAGWGLEVAAFENVSSLPAECTPDALIVDVRGRDAALWPELLRSHPALADRPVIGLASVGIPALEREALRTSFRALLKKPLRDALLHEVLKSVLRA
jgi:PAS domain S-box-containing protein